MMIGAATGSSHMASLARIVSGAVMIVVMTIGGGGVAVAAGSDGTILRYRCAMPLFPEQLMTVRLTWNAPKSVVAGQKTPIVPLKAVATMGSAVTDGLNMVGAATVEGRAIATGVVSVRGDDELASLPLTVPRTPVPSEGATTVVANGKTPELVFHRPGHGTITVGREFDVRLLPKTDDGGLTMVDEVEASCALEPGQDTVLASFEVTAPRAKPAPTAGKPAAPTATRNGGPHASETRGAPGTTGPGDSSTAPNSSTAPSSEILVTSETDTTAAHNTAFTPVSTRGLAAAAGPWLVAGAILVVGTILGCVYWLARRRRRASRQRRGAL
jgi:hypothetical protein